MNEPKPMRVIAVEEDGAVEVRPLTWSERLAYRLAYEAGAAAASVVNAVGWLAAALGFKR